MDAILEIRLLSDLCCGTGEGNGNQLDIRSAYDECGLPVLPGKRIKGLLRDRALFLAMHGYVTHAAVLRLFGTSEQKGLLHIETGQLKNADAIKTELMHLPESIKDLVSSKAVEAAYTIPRFGTTVEEDGTAKDHSLRMIGTIPRGEVFYVPIQLQAEQNSEEWRLLTDACQLLRNIGLNRSRGMGEVACSLTSIPSKKDACTLPIKKNSSVRYTIELCAPLLSQTDYITGTSLQGWFAGQLCHDEPWFTQIFLHQVRFGNGYLVCTNHSSAPMPLGMISEKNADHAVYSLADGYTRLNGKQYTGTSGFYSIAEKSIYKASVARSINYHFTTQNDRDLYTISSLNSGQIFQGEIHASTHENLEKLLSVVQQNRGILHLGGSARSQYAKCHIHFSDIPVLSEQPLEGDLVVEFISDVILLNEFGINTGDASALRSALKHLVELQSDIADEDIFTSFVTVGGYNAKWKLPRRRYQAFVKGTQIRVRGKAKKLQGQIGLLQSEGYGAYLIRAVGETTYAVETNTKAPESSTEPIYAKPLIAKVLLHLLYETCKEHATTAATKYLTHSTGLSSSCAMRLQSAYQASERQTDFLSQITAYIKTNFKGKSNEGIHSFAKYALQSFSTLSESLEEPHKKVCQENQDTLFRRYLLSYIAAAKLYYREVEL